MLGPFNLRPRPSGPPVQPVQRHLQEEDRAVGERRPARPGENRTSEFKSFFSFETTSKPVLFFQGSVGEASEDVSQVVKVMGLGGMKWSWLTSKLVEFTSAGSVLIFVTKKQNCEELAHNLKAKEFDCRYCSDLKTSL